MSICSKDPGFVRAEFLQAQRSSPRKEYKIVSTILSMKVNVCLEWEKKSRQIIEDSVSDHWNKVSHMIFFFFGFQIHIKVTIVYEVHNSIMSEKMYISYLKILYC